MNEKIIFKSNKVKIENLLKNLFEKVSMQKLKITVHFLNSIKIWRDCNALRTWVIMMTFTSLKSLPFLKRDLMAFTTSLCTALHEALKIGLQNQAKMAKYHCLPKYISINYYFRNMLKSTTFWVLEFGKLKFSMVLEFHELEFFKKIAFKFAIKFFHGSKSNATPCNNKLMTEFKIFKKF